MSSEVLIPQVVQWGTRPPGHGWRHCYLRAQRGDPARGRAALNTPAKRWKGLCL